MPEIYYSEFFPKKVEDVVTYLPKPNPRLQEEKKSPPKKPLRDIKNIQKKAIVDVFNIPDNSGNKDNIFNDPIKPFTTKDKENYKKDAPIAKLNVILGKMQQEELVEQQKKEAEQNRLKDLYSTVYPAWMQYPTGIPIFNPLGVNSTIYGTNMSYRNIMSPLTNPVSHPISDKSPQVNLHIYRYT